MSVRFGSFAFHPDRRQLLRDGEDVHLTRKAFDLLTLLIERAPAVVSKAEIHERLWPGAFVSDATLAGLVKEVRRALDDDGRRALVRTAHRIGFAFTGRPPAVSAAAAPAALWIVVGTERFDLQEGVTVIGRDADAGIRLNVPGVSRRHARIVVEHGVATLEDLGSKNGTIVANRQASGPVVLRHGDQIAVATELLVFHVSADSEASTITQPVGSE